MSYSDTEWEAWAAANAQALSNASDWLLRKRDRIALSDAVMTRRTLEIEFAIPSEVSESPLNLDRVPLVIAYVPKRRLAPVEVTDAAGVLLSTFNSIEAARFNEAVLAANASQVVGQDLVDQAPPAGWRALIAEVLSAPPPAGRTSDQQAADVSGQEGNASPARGPEQEQWQTRAREMLATDEGFVVWVASLSTHDPVVIELSAQDASRRVVRVAYDMRLDRAQTPRDVQPGLWRQLGQTIGWSETRVVISIPEIEAPSAYELDINTPEGIELTDVSASRSEGRQEDEPAAPASAARLSARFARVSCPAIPRRAALLVQFRLRPQRSYPVAVLLTSLAAALVLTAGWLRLRTVAGSADAATALLLALPALFTTLVARPGRRTPAASMVVGARLVLALIGLLTYIAAGMLVLYPTDPQTRLSGTLHLVWLVDLLLCWALVVLLVSPLYGPAMQARRRRRG